MSLTADLISDFVKATKDSTTTKTETTVYGTVVDYDNSKWVRIDGSDRLTPIKTTVNINNEDRVIVSIKNHTATITGNLTTPSATTKDVDNVSNQISEFEIIIADKVSTEELEVERGRIDTLVSENVVIKETLTASNVDISNLTADYVTINEKLTATEAEIKDLKTTKLDAEVADITYATIKNLEATNATVTNLSATYGEFAKLTTDKLNANDASIKNLETSKLDAETANITYAKISTLESDYAKITDLNATNATVGNLSADVADIDTLIFGSASGTTIQTSFANAVIAQLGNAQIKSAMIESISASKITAGDIITNNVRVMSEDGSLLISDETIQISDDTRVRVQIGKDAANDYSINIWDANGNLMFSEGGITDSAIKDAIIRNDMVANNANISASKLDIDSLFEEINGSSKTIKSTKIYLDDESQTLDVAFTSMTTEVGDLSNTVSSQGTQISTIQGQISSKIWQQDINTATNELKETTETLSTQYSTLDQEVDGISATVASHTTQISNKANSSEVTAVSDRVTSVEQNLNGFKTTVSNTYATKEVVNTAVKEVRQYYYQNESVILAETSPVYDADNQMFYIYDAFSIDAGKRYTVNWNGVAYSCVAQEVVEDDLSISVLGDISNMTGGESTGEPFLITEVPSEIANDLGGATGQMAAWDGSTSVTLSITGDDGTIPEKPTTYPPNSKWTEIEPGNSDISMYSTLCTVYMDDTFDYSDVSTSTAINAAINANRNAGTAQINSDSAVRNSLEAIGRADYASGLANDNKSNLSKLTTRVTNAESSIEQNSESITSLVSRTEVVENKFDNYSTTSEMNSAIEQKANSITSTVSSTYATKTALAATDTKATNAANAAASAQESVDTAYAKVTSKGEQLVTNGSALMGDNTNFSGWTFDGAVTNNTPGSFSRSTRGLTSTDEYFPVNPQNEYTLTFDAKSLLGKGTMYSMLLFYDVDKKMIEAANHMYVSGTLTTLAQDLKAGDTVIYLTDVSGWRTDVSNSNFMSIWNYTNSFGYTYPSETYTRNRITLPANGNKLNSANIDYTANTITLTTAYSGSTVPAGTEASQGRSGSTYKYNGFSNKVIPTDWISAKGVYNGVDYSGNNISTKFSPGTAYAKVGFLWNYNNTAGETQWITNVSVTDTTSVSAAQNTADAAKEAADAAQDDVDAVETRVTKAESSIEQNSESITSLVSRTEVVENKFDNYSTTSEMNSAIEQSASEINSSVSATYATKTALNTTNTNVTNAANAAAAAQSTANTAKTNAETAQNTANTAKTNAATAQSAAEAAQSTANTAKTNAATAQSTAEAAQSAADAAQDDVDALAENVSTNYATKSEVTQTANEISSTVSATTTIANKALSQGVEYIVGTQTAATNAWTGVSTSDSLYTGKTIAYKLPYAGTSSSATLNLTLADGSTTGAKGLRRLNSTVTTNYVAGSVINMTYDGTYWRISDYDANTYDRVRYNQAIMCGTTAIVAANIIVGANGVYKHLKAGTAFDISYPILYASSAIAASATGTNNYLCIPFAVKTTQSLTLTAYKPVYIKGTLSGKMFTPVSTKPLTQTEPTSNDGYFYMLLGTAYSTTNMYLTEKHPMYKYDANSPAGFKAVEQILLESQTRISQTESSITSLVSTTDSLGTRTSTLEQTAEGFTASISELESDVSTAQSTANTAKTNAATAQSTANTATTIAKSSPKKINTHMRNFTKANWETYGTAGHSESWTTGSSYDNSHIYVGDIAYIVGTVSDAGGSNTVSATIYGTVTSKTTSAVVMTTLYYIMGGEGGAYALANTANTNATNAAKTATNYLNFSSSGLVIGDMTASTLGRNVLIDSDSVDIRSGSTVLASYSDSKIQLGMNSTSSVIELCGGTGTIYYGDMPSISSTNFLTMQSTHVGLYATDTIYETVRGDSSFTWIIMAENNIELYTANIISDNEVGGSTISIDPDKITIISDLVEMQSGNLYVGSKVRIYSSTEGGNIRITSPNGIAWEMDAHDDNFRLYRDNNGSYVFPLAIGSSDGVVYFNAGGIVNRANTYADQLNQQCGFLIMNSTTKTYRLGLYGYAKSTATSNACIFYDNTNARGIWHYDAVNNNFIVDSATLSAMGDMLLTTGNLKWNSKAHLASPSSQLLYIGASNETGYRLLLGVRDSAWRITPETSGYLQIGSSNYKFGQIYSTNSSISTSDRTLKKEIQSLTDIHVKFFTKLHPVSFQFIDGTSGRTHVGFVAQDVEEAMHACGLTDLDFAGFCKDQKCESVKKIRMEEREVEVPKEVEVKHVDDETGEVYTTTEIVSETQTVVEEVEYLEDVPIEGEYIYSLRYEEFIALNTHMIQKLYTELTSLKSEIETIRSVIGI